jgi:hypothetical protein
MMLIKVHALDLKKDMIFDSYVNPNLIITAAKISDFMCKEDIDYDDFFVYMLPNDKHMIAKESPDEINKLYKIAVEE